MHYECIVCPKAILIVPCPFNYHMLSWICLWYYAVEPLRHFHRTAIVIHTMDDSDWNTIDVPDWHQRSDPIALSILLK